MNSIVIQPFSSRFETIRVKLHNEAFKDSGIEIFERENVPFAGRTGHDFAQGLISLLVSRIKTLNLKTDKIHIYEFAAGNGILAKRLLDNLKKNHENVYERVILHLSDNSRPIIKQLKSLEFVKEHQGHLSIEFILKYYFILY